jgi:dTDP-4-amino-4,6-dideoxygalactose transaminase
MPNSDVTRRAFVGAAALATTASTSPAAKSDDKPALLGGEPVRSAKWPSWPQVSQKDEIAWMDVLKGGHWNRRGGHYLQNFEEVWARTLGAKHCLATANGTAALITALNALEVGPGDEVIVPVYTFVATVNSVLMHHALPVFVDTDQETFQIDARKIEVAITPRTRVIVPVHIGGSPADLDTILAIGKQHGIPVLEDACQAHLAEWRGRKVSTLGDIGCFSFQASKNLNSGEGGCVITNHDNHLEVCRSFHDNGRGSASAGFNYVRNGCNLRMTEFQAALLIEQMSRLEEQSRQRAQNAQYLTSLLRQIPGIAPARMYEGCTRNAYHLYMFRYDQQRFANLPRARFLKALAAEGVPASGGYTPLNKEPLIEHTLGSRAYQRIYDQKTLNEYRERVSCPANDKLCAEGVWLMQTMLLGSRSDMDQIAEAIRKIHAHAASLALG